MSLVAKNLDSIRKELVNSKSLIIAVSKYVTVDQMMEAYDAGIRDFGENKVKNALEKKDEMSDDVVKNISWHFIGHLQSNKAKKVVGEFDYIHSVDSLKLAQVIDDVAAKKELTQNVLLQVNISEEQSKFGLTRDELFDVFEPINALENIKIKGLMTMAPNSDDEDYLRSLFQQMSQLKSEIEEKFNVSIQELSMGMSNDYKIAAQEGSTMVRIGTKIFK